MHILQQDHKQHLPSYYALFSFKMSHFITVNILMETSLTDRIWAFLIVHYVYSNSLRRPERAHLPQGIQRYAQTQAHTHTPRGACQCTLRSYSPGVKSFRDDPQNTLLRSMQHAACTCTVKPLGRNGPRYFPWTAVSSYSFT